MGRAFELRKARKMKRWDKMSKAFTRLGREIAIAVKLGGADPASNARLRIAMTNAKGVNMPKDRIEGAIKRASSKEEQDFQEIIYECYAPHGVPMIIECATDNPTRTVANVRMRLSRAGGTLGMAGSLDFMFTRKGVFKLAAQGLKMDELELELIDFGAEEIMLEGNEITIITSFNDFSSMQKALEEKKLPVTSAELQRMATVTKELSEEAEEEVLELIENLEEDDDVQAVYHNMV
ncbi:MAG: YebC/PmpR family DNA-binding transcriptional regulator [Candidatus Kapaibacterium sp.]|jgi:YebC/PmpR family DNA-binding regulatory protein